VFTGETSRRKIGSRERYDAPQGQPAEPFVERDDLPDQGAGHFAETICGIKDQHPGLLVEVLIPDF